MREEHQQVLGLVLDLPGEAGKEVLADPHAARRGIGRGLVDDGAGPAEIDIAVIGDELDGGRREVDRDLLLYHRLVALEPAPQRRIARHHPQRGRPFLDAGELGEREAHLLLRDRRCELLGGDGGFRTARGQRDRQRLEAAARVADRDLQRRGADHGGIRREPDLRRLRLEARPEMDPGGDHARKQDNQEDENYRKLAARTFVFVCAHELRSGISTEVWTRYYGVRLENRDTANRVAAGGLGPAGRTVVHSHWCRRSQTRRIP